MQQLHNTQTGLKKHGSNPLLGVTFGVTNKIILVSLDIVGRQVVNNAVISISTGILVAVI